MVRHQEIDRPVIAVAGLGPRGMVIVERLIAHMAARPDQMMDIVLFDSNAPGAGVHRPDLPDYLLLNTVAGQLSFYPHADAVSGNAVHKGPNLHEWCQEKGLRVSSRGGMSADPACRPVAPGDFLPRRILGQYLEDCAKRLLENLPDHIRLRLIQEKLIDVIEDTLSGRQCLVTQSGKRIWADSLFLSLGHAREADLQSVGIKAKETVAVSGLGLTAMDTVAALTKGRGGLFAGGFDDLRYVQSGREPRILLTSRTGLPFFARPDWSPEEDKYRVPPIFLTRDAVDRLRAETSKTGGQLCFRTQVLPLLTLDMQAAFHITRTRLIDGEDAANLLLQDLMMLGDMPQLAAAKFAQIEDLDGPSGIERLLRTEPWQGHDPEFSRDYRAQIKADLAQCKLGLPGSPIKAAAEVWRSQRNILRYVANGRGLTDASRAEFYRVFAPLSNRLVGGPQKERHAELLALCAADVVTLVSPESQSITADRFYAAFTGSAGTCRRDNPIVRNLLASGRIRPVDPAGLDGISVDAHGHPLDAQGNPDTALWLVGPPVEGASFYNHYVGTPAPDCPLFVDAEREVGRCLNRIDPPLGQLAAHAQNRLGAI